MRTSVTSSARSAGNGDVHSSASSSDSLGSNRDSARSPVGLSGVSRKEVVINGAVPVISPRRTGFKYIAQVRCFVNSKLFSAVTSFLTLYALTADDIRVIFTEKPVDPFFNVMVVVCLVVFSLEILLSCIAKKDYFLGFYFFLDTIATATLIGDLGPIADGLANASNDASGATAQTSNLRSARSARIGARAARLVRVVRLVRILKLYKAYYEAREKAKREEQQKEPGGEDDWADEDLREDEQRRSVDNERESRVGKRLSEITTRRVVCLILALLMILPLLRVESVNQTPPSTLYGADTVWQAYKDWDANPSEDRSHFDKVLLHYIFFHNWFSVSDDKYCPTLNCNNEFNSGLLWLGVQSRSYDNVMNMTQKLRLSDQSVQSFAARNLGFADWASQSYGTVPTAVLGTLASSWDVNCDYSGFYLRGISLLANGAVPRSDEVTCPSQLRAQETIAYAPMTTTSSESAEWQFIFFFDVRPFLHQDAMFSLGVTGFVMVLLVVGSLVFTYDANRLVLTPVEKMIERVEAIREDPLVAMKMADDEFKAEEVAKARLLRARRERLKKVLTDVFMCEYFSRGKKDVMETVILEKTIIKLGSLLVLGFGEAGAQIIGQNMSGSDTAGVNAMVAGRRVECIIGIVRVRDFSTATEVLQSKIMTFGNQIAEIVHGVCSEFHGAPNKNNGDQFMIIWRMEDNSTPVWARRLSEMSLVACATMLGAVHRSPVLATYRGHPGLQNRWGSNCRVNLSFGLHKGWAIEGAIGSEFKIDASYLSPNVSVAMNVERATEIYGVPLMAAQSVVAVCSKQVTARCRLIDRVIITGSVTPMDVYCIDLDYMSVKIDDARPLQITWNTRNRFKARQFMEAEKTAMRREDFDLNRFFDSDPAIAVMRKRYTVEFFQLFNMGYQNYSQGEWGVARRMLSCTRSLLGVEDGPSSALLRFMEVPHQFVAPKDWCGVRELKFSHVLERSSFSRTSGSRTVA